MRRKLISYFISLQELPLAERLELEKQIKVLKNELRNEEMKLILLKKLRQSQQMKENISILPVNNANASQPAAPPSHSSSTMKTSNSAHRSSTTHHSKPSPTTPPVPPLLRGVSNHSFARLCCSNEG